MRLILILLITLLSIAVFSQELDVIFDKISESDTLKIKAHINDSTDCGEFGGHHEYLLINRIENNQLKIRFKKLPSDCPWKQGGNIIEKEIILSETESKLIQEFLLNLEKLNKTETSFSHAYQEFIVEFMGQTTKVWDGLGLWLGYEIFRNELIK